MTDNQILVWIKNNLSAIIKEAISQSPGTIVTEDWLAGINCRETGELIAKKLAQGVTEVHSISAFMMGDYVNDIPQGYGFWQIDIKSFPEFVRSGDWKDPLKCARKAIEVLEGKKKYLVTRFAVLAGDSLKHYITAAYNTGEGREAQVISKNLDPDAYTTHHDYSKEVLEFADYYRTLN